MTSYLRIARIWWQALRYHFVPPTIFPTVTGALIWWSGGQSVDITAYVLILLTMTLHHVVLNMTDDYFDYRQAVDQHRPDGHNPYAGGSGVLTSGLMKPGAMVKAIITGYLMTIGVGLYLVGREGWPVLWFGVIGIFSSLFYTAPPIRYSHRGLGEIGLLLNFGPVIGLGSYYVQAHTLTWNAFWGTLPCGLMLFAMIVLNEIPDADSDRRAGKRTLVVRFGNSVALRLYGIAWLATYGGVITGVLLDYMPVTTLLVLAGLPYTAGSYWVAFRALADNRPIGSANRLMMKSYNFSGAFLIIGYSIDGIINIAGIYSFIWIFAGWLAVYLPAVLLPPAVPPGQGK